MKGGEGPTRSVAHVVDIGLVAGSAELDFLRVFKRGEVADSEEQQWQDAKRKQVQPQGIPLGLPASEDDERYDNAAEDRDCNPNGEKNPPIQPTPPLQPFTIDHVCPS
jgi:hypothetical protein